MKLDEYTLEKISYSRKEDCRIMETVFKHWLKDPKELNFFSPNLLFPFNFKKFLKIYDNKNNSLVLKSQNWIIGYISFQIKYRKLSIIHLFIDLKHRNLGLATMLLREIEKICGLKNKFNSKKTKEIIKVARKSIVTNKFLKKNHKLKKNDVVFKRPGTGISPLELDKILGKKLNKNLESDRVIKYKFLKNR